MILLPYSFKNPFIFTFTSSSLKNNGSVKYLINDEFVAMSAAGTIEDTSDPAVLLENKSSFVQRWQKAKQDWSDDALPMNVLSVPSAHKKVCNISLFHALFIKQDLIL